MGKSKHASFSSIDKPNFLHIKTKFRHCNSRKKIKENEKNGGNSDAEEKEKKRFWCKWLGFVRKRWTSAESCRTANAADYVISRNFETNKNVQLKSQTTSTDFIETPIGPEEKISTILIKPTKTGLKAVIAPNERSQDPETPQENMLVSGDVFPELPQMDSKKEAFDEKPVKTKMPNLHADSFSTGTELPKNSESLFTSALFIRHDLDKVVESAVFFEPNFPKDYSELKNFDDISQKSTKCNKKRPINRITDEYFDPIIKTFKTASEPTCKERTKIIQHQRLKDNINNLIKQFMFLEAEELFDFSVLQKVTDCKETIQCSNVDSKTNFFKQLSREVSPEILANKKPFKEYVSNGYINVERPSDVKMNKNESYKVERDSIRTKTTITFEEEKASQTTAEPCACADPLLKSSATFVKRKGSQKSYDVTLSIPAPPTAEKEIKNIYYENLSEVTSDWGSVTVNDEYESEIPTCRIWGVYKSYPCSNIIWEEKKPETLRNETVVNLSFKEKKVEKAPELKAGNSKEKVEDSKDLAETEFHGKSLDEIIASLGKENHNIIFQKNIGQFKKKINVMPRFDFRKSASNTLKVITDNAVQKTKQTQIFQIAKPVQQSVANTAKVSIGNLRENKIEKFKFECLELINRKKAERVLENIYFTASDVKLLCRTLSTRIEARTVSFLQTFKEVYSLMENNNSTIMEMVIPRSFENDLIKITLIRIENDKALNWSPRFSFESDNYEESSSLVPQYEFNRSGIQSESSSSFLDTDECLLLCQDLIYMPDIEAIDLQNQDITDKRLVRTSTETLIKAVFDENEELEMEKNEENKVTSRTENILIFQPCFEAPQNVVEILNNSYRAYSVQMHDNVLPFQKLSIKNLSDSDLSKKIVSLVTKPYSDSAVASLNNFISIETMITPNKENPTEREKKQRKVNDSLDGFQILYNNSKENLDDEEEITRPIFGRRLMEKDPGFIVENIFREEEEDEDVLKKKNFKAENDDATENPEKKTKNILKFKSNSSPGESIIQTDFCLHEHRFRRSFILSKDLDKDVRKRRFHFGKGIEIRRTGSATVGNKSVHSHECLNFVKNFFLPAELKTVLASENKGEGNKKIFVVDKSGAKVDKDLVVAAFNSIKEFNSCKGEAKDGGKRMSLVIMLSKNRSP